MKDEKISFLKFCDIARKFFYNVDYITFTHFPLSEGGLGYTYCYLESNTYLIKDCIKNTFTVVYARSPKEALDSFIKQILPF